MSLVKFNESNIKTRFIKNLLEHSYVPSVNTLSNSDRETYVDVVLPPILPSEYQQVEYIENTGKQYIDTGVIGNQKTGFDVTFNTASRIDEIDYGCILGGRIKKLNNEIQITTYTDTILRKGTLRYGNEQYNAQITSNTLQTASLLNRVYHSPKGETISLPAIAELNTTNTITLFALNESAGVTQWGLVKMYSCKIYNGYDVIRDFIPCYRKSDRVVGMYDLITKRFYTNSGIGEFTAGPVVINTRQEKMYDVQLNADYLYKDSIIRASHREFGNVEGSFKNIRDEYDPVDIVISVRYDDFVKWALSHADKPTESQWKSGITFTYRCSTAPLEEGNPYTVSWEDEKGINREYLITSEEELSKTGILTSHNLSESSYATITISCDVAYKNDKIPLSEYIYSTISKINYDINTYIPQYTRYFKNRYNYYDSETHAYLGDYLRTLRDVYNLDLMPLYNVFNEQYISDIELKLNESYKVVFNDTDTNTYKVYAVPIKYNKPYTIALNCNSNVLISPILYDNRALVKNIPETQEDKYYTEFLKYDSSINIGGMTFNKPYVFQGVSSEMSDEGVSIFEDANFLYNQERNLYLLLQVPKNNKSSLVVIEGQYNFDNCEKVVNLGDIKEETDLSDFCVNTTYISKPDILSVNDGNNYAFSDRLIEYLILNTIDNNDKIEFNILDVQRKLGLPETTIWNDEMRINLYNRLLSLSEDKRKQINIDNKDILGYVDKDVERYLNSILFEQNFDDPTTTKVSN